MKLDDSFHMKTTTRTMKKAEPSPIPRFPTMLLVVAAVTAIGVVLILVSKAAVPTASLEPETGEIAGTAKPKMEPNTSGDSVVQFGTASSTSIPGYKLIWSEDFNTDAALGSFVSNSSGVLTAPASYVGRISAYPQGWKDTTHKGTYSPQQTMSVANSILDIWLHKDAASGLTYVGNPGPFSVATQTYGRYDLRMKIAAGSTNDFQIVPLLWPTSGKWPDDGEEDFPDNQPNNTVTGHHHFASAAGGQNEVKSTYKMDVWHTYTIIWTSSRVQYLVDGTVVGDFTTAIPSKPMRWQWQVETNLSSTPVAADASTHVQIDWAKVYAPN